MGEEIETIQYLIFTMADELVVVDGARVRDILELASLTKGTLLPDFMQGVIDLRGCHVPVIDLQLKLTSQEHLQPLSTFNISVEMLKAGENVVLSGLVDSVQEAAIEMVPSQIDAAPHWLRCRLSKKDIKALVSNFINASVTKTAAKPKGEAPWPL